MDKIAQKFTAQDMIKANAAAEEKELERLRLQVAEYDTRIQEIRKLNLKNLELADNLQAMIDEENARIKEYAGAQKATQAQEFNLNAELEKAAGSSSEQLEEMTQKLTAQAKQIAMAKLETMERLDALENRLNTRPVLEQITAKLEETSAPEELLARLDCHSQLSGIEAKLESRPTFDEIVELLGKDESPEGLVQRLDAVKEELTDHVHKENVKVYRNVQAAVADENKKLIEAITASRTELKEQLAKTEKKVSGLKVLSIVTLIAALANIGLWVLSILNLFPTF